MHYNDKIVPQKVWREKIGVTKFDAEKLGIYAW